MEITSLSLRNFRNFKELDLNFSSGLNLVVGKNRIGKTNLIEALFLLSALRSFRKENHLINYDERIAYLEAQLRFNPKENSLPLSLVLSQKADGLARPLGKQASFKRIRWPLIELVGTLGVVLFLPETLEMVLREPQTRRKALNLILGMTEKKHLKNLGLYQRNLLSRNQLLKKTREGRGTSGEFDFWEKGLADLGEEIQEKRLELMEFLNQRITNFYQILSKTKEKLVLNYSKTFKAGTLHKLFQTKRLQEIKLGETLFGPHRESFEFELGGHPLRLVGSRGEVRSAALAFKRAELDWYLEKTSNRPILLLDDVLAELDKERCQALIELIQGGQLILTATNWERVPQNLLKNANRISLGERV